MALPRNSASADVTYLVSFVPLNNVSRNRRIVNLEQPQTIGRQLDKEDAPPTSLKFASKVVSRQHAVIGFAADGKLYLRDTKSSSGTFLNGQRLSPQAQESSRVEVHDGDVIRLGEDCEVNGVVHQSVILKVLFGSISSHQRSISQDSNLVELSREGDPGEHYVDFSSDPQVRANVDAEFNFIWNSLTHGLDHPLKRLRQISAATANQFGSPSPSTIYGTGSRRKSIVHNVTLPPTAEILSSQSRSIQGSPRDDIGSYNTVIPQNYIYPLQTTSTSHFASPSSQPSAHGLTPQTPSTAYPYITSPHEARPLSMTSMASHASSNTSSTNQHSINGNPSSGPHSTASQLLTTGSLKRISGASGRRPSVSSSASIGSPPVSAAAITRTGPSLSISSTSSVGTVLNGTAQYSFTLPHPFESQAPSSFLLPPPTPSKPSNSAEHNQATLINSKAKHATLTPAHASSNFTNG
ncbi:hypothetical protein DFS34DRAFT_597055 [Phlyctochytrium arcticum]|nr:hypothetical protein DFS34DRAFT_597055 [Phlyctochytrium arcticum]